MAEKTKIVYITTVAEEERRKITENNPDCDITFVDSSINHWLSNQKFDEIWIDEEHPDALEYEKMLLNDQDSDVITIVTPDYRKFLANLANQ